jgi:phage terminase large subunit
MPQHCVIPYAPRRWAIPFHATTRRWLALILHRRAGKSTGVLNHHIRAALDNEWEANRLRSLMPNISENDLTHLMRDRFYGHVMPSRVQAKMVVWDMAKYYCSAIPKLKPPNESELLIRFPGGSRLQFFGADDPDALRGAGFSGLSFDEYSQQPANIFSEVLSKALADHLGYAIFAGTIKGKDHLYRTYDAGKDDDAWFTLWQDIDTSLRDETGATIQALERAMRDDRALVVNGLMTQAEFDQEWYLSPEAAIKGAIYMDELTALRTSGRITGVPYDPTLPVDTAWDLGMSMAIWFSQSTPAGEVRIIDYYESDGESSLPECAAVLRKKGYVYGRHWAPHDIMVRDLSSGKTRLEVAHSLGISFTMVPKLGVEDGIHAVRMLLPRCYFDKQRTAVGLEALLHYRRDFNKRLQEFKPLPLHDFASHGADGFRYLAVGHQTPKVAKPRLQQTHRASAAIGLDWMGG